MTNVPIINQEKSERIVAELEGAGIYHHARHPFMNNYLPRFIHDDEHIMGAVFSRRKESEGFFGFVEGLLVATNERVLFLDHRAGYTTMDEVSYDVITGVHLSTTLLYSSVTLLTKVTNYKLSFANHTSARKFVDYIQSRLPKKNDSSITATTGDNTAKEKPPYEMPIQDEAWQFLQSHEVGVLSTIERTGSLTNAVIYYTTHDGYLYFMTKEDSRKADNILGNQHIAFVVFDEAKLQTVQMQGIVEQVEDDSLKMQILRAMMHPRTYKDGSHKPPILRMSNAGIETYRIIPTRYNFTDYSRR